MTDLSRCMRTLASHMPKEEAARAQALATALDPENEMAVRYFGEVSLEPDVQDPLAETAEACVKRIGPMVTWLEQAAAGKDGNRLAACLKDMIAATAPGQLRVADFKGDWTDWLPPTTSGDGPNGGRKIKGDEPSDGASPEKFQIRLAEAQIETVLPPLNARSNPSRTSWSNVTVRMSVREISDDLSRPFSIVIGQHSEQELPLIAPTSILDLLESIHGKLPGGIEVRINCAELEKSIRAGLVRTNHVVVAALASAALSGREPDNAIVLGEIDKDGGLILPQTAWAQMRTMEGGNGRRLVLPKTAETMLPSLLVVSKPSFFFDFQVLLASGYKEILDLSTKNPSEAHALIFDKFKEIHDRAEGRNLSEYLANRFVRERLQQLADSAPQHASAAMLLLLTSNERPRHLARPVLARELRQALKPIDWIAGNAVIEPGSNKISKFHDSYVSSRLAVDKLKELSATGDLGLWEKTLGLIMAVREFERCAKAKGDYLTQQLEIEKSQRDFVNHHNEVTKLLNNEINATPP
jgi:hypothetical protein